MGGDESLNVGSTTKVTLIVGVTGHVGKELAELLAARFDWKVYGIALKPDDGPSVSGRRAYHFIPCDLLDAKDAARELSSLRDITHVFWVTWTTQFPHDSQVSRDQNKAMMSNVLDVILLRSPALKHI